MQSLEWILEVINFLLGNSGTGKYSLCRLAIHISGQRCFKFDINEEEYDMKHFMVDLRAIVGTIAVSSRLVSDSIHWNWTMQILNRNRVRTSQLRCWSARKKYWTKNFWNVYPICWSHSRFPTMTIATPFTIQHLKMQNNCTLQRYHCVPICMDWFVSIQ